MQIRGADSSETEKNVIRTITPVTMKKLQNLIWDVGRIARFMGRVLRGFKRNQGLLLSGAVAYYTLLSIIPMSILILIALSHFIDQEQLFHTLSTYLEMMIPGYATTLTEQARVFLEHRRVIGIIGLLVMLFFSSIAFTVLENAMSVIFFHRVRILRRHFIVSAIIPYVYIFLVALGILLVSFIAGALEVVTNKRWLFLGWSLSLENFPGVVLYILGMLGEVLMLTSLYLVMPVGRITFHHALIGGITGNYPPCPCLVLFGHLAGKFNLWFVHHGGGVPPQHRGGGADPPAGRSGDRRV